MKLVLLLLLCVLGTVVVAQETSSIATPTPAMESDVGGIDPIFDAYENKAKELYGQALIDYYHAHPSRLDDDLSRLTTPEYEVFVPSELLQEFHIDKAKLEEKIKENDRMTDNNDETDVQAQDEEEDNQMETNAENDFETNQFGRFGRAFGFGRGFGFPYGGFYGGGFGFPYGGGFGRKQGGYGGYGGYGFPYGGFGYGGFGFRRFGFL